MKDAEAPLKLNARRQFGEKKSPETRKGNLEDRKRTNFS